jgi:hypothetical protein
MESSRTKSEHMEIESGFLEAGGRKNGFGRSGTI